MRGYLTHLHDPPVHGVCLAFCRFARLTRPRGSRGHSRALRSHASLALQGDSSGHKLHRACSDLSPEATLGTYSELPRVALKLSGLLEARVCGFDLEHSFSGVSTSRPVSLPPSLPGLNSPVVRFLSLHPLLQVLQEHPETSSHLTGRAPSRRSGFVQGSQGAGEQERCSLSCPPTHPWAA